MVSVFVLRRPFLDFEAAGNTQQAGDGFAILNVAAFDHGESFGHGQTVQFDELVGVAFQTRGGQFGGEKQVYDMVGKTVCAIDGANALPIRGT